MQFLFDLWNYIFGTSLGKTAPQAATPSAQDRAEDRIFNPREIVIGDTILVDFMPEKYGGKKFKALELLEYDPQDTRATYTDCVGVERLSNEQIRFRTLIQGTSLRTILLHKFDEAAESTGIGGAVKDPGGIFICNVGGDKSKKQTFNMIDGIRPMGVETNLTLLKNKDTDIRISRDEITVAPVTCWSFARKAKGEHPGVDEMEYLFVERDATGLYTLWKGYAVNGDRIRIGA